MAEITEQGFVGKTENEYFDDEIELYQSIDPEWNLDSSTPDGLKAASDAEIFVNLDEAAQNAYNSKDPGKAIDVELNIISSLSGTERNLGDPSTVNLTLGGVNGTIIEAGKTVESEVDSSQWTTDTEVTIVAGTASVGATAVLNGATQADSSSITVIVDTVGGWQTVTNDAVAQPGTDKETNPELRLKRAITVGRPGNNQIDSMLGEIGNVTGVSRFAVYSNDEATPDADGVPGHNLAILVQGGTDADIAQAIYIKKNPGVGLYGAGTPVVVNVQSPVHPSNNKDITFGRPTNDAMIVVVDITNDGTLPAGTDVEVEDAIIEYAEGSLITSTTGFNSTGFDIGEDVGVSRLYTPVNSVIGALGASYVTNLTVDGVTTTVAVAFDAVSTWTKANITVNIT